MSGKTLLHLQCHFGMDTLSFAHRGAEATGVDFSSKAIEYARKLSDEMSIPSRFISSSISNLHHHLNEKFDIVFTSYGVLAWLGDLNEWASVIANYLKPDGIFYIIDEHPFARVLTEARINKEKGYIELPMPYQNNGKAIEVAFESSYAEPNCQLESFTQFIWFHGLNEILNSLLTNGLKLEFFHEFHKSFYCMMKGMEKNDQGWWILKSNRRAIPLMFSIRCNKDV